MAHELTIRENGLVEAMYAQKPAWHGLGVVLEDAPDSETAMREAHLDTLVETQPIYLSDGQELPDNKAVVRLVEGEDPYPLGVVGNRYECYQNAEAFQFLDSLLMDGVMRYEAAFSLRGGRNVCLLARLPSIDYVTDSDPLLRYLLLHTSHDGSSAIQVQATSVRVVCANTLSLALREKCDRFSVRHTANAKRNLDVVREAISQYDTQFTLHTDNCRKLLATAASKEQSNEYMNTLFPEDADATTRQQNSRIRKFGALRAGYRRTIQDNPEAKGTFWGLYNGVSWAVDHSDEFSRYRGTERQRKERRFSSLIEGTGSKLKHEAFELALASAC